MDQIAVGELTGPKSKTSRLGEERNGEPVMQPTSATDGSIKTRLPLAFGTFVKGGSVIGWMGNSGRSKGFFWEWGGGRKKETRLGVAKSVF